MKNLPGGSFVYGYRESLTTRTVNAFKMDVTEVTVAAYRECVAAGKCSSPCTAEWCNWDVADKDNHPINCVDYHQADEFCAWHGKRLPTEEEWEYAARGTDGRTYPWGNDAPGTQLCWMRGEDHFSFSDLKRARELPVRQPSLSMPAPGSCPIGSFPSGNSPFGLMDMGGNVMEWTSTRDGDGRVGRGGAWPDEDPDFSRSSYRALFMSTDRLNHLGFRCAMSLSLATAESPASGKRKRGRRGTQ
jgi:formylglycine-generating enzyme required for sulfatase activity